MTRSAAAKVTAAADALLDWLRTQPRAAAIEAPPLAGAAGPPDGAGVTETAVAGPTPGAPLPGRWAPPGSWASPGVAAPADRQALDGTDPAPNAIPPQAVASASPTNPSPGPRWPRRGEGQRQVPLRLAHTDWLYHRLTIAGPADEMAAFRDTAAGAGIIPWHFDLDRMQEDFFHLLVAPPPPQQRTLSLPGARILARQLGTAVARRHELALARVGRSRACAFDLHALVPVPEAVLRLGPDDPDSFAWLWDLWGTTQALRHVAEDADTGADDRHRPAPGEARFHLTFWSADWTPWRALVQVAARWPVLRFETRPTYDAS